MTLRTARCAAWLMVAAVATLTLTGCGGTLKMKLVNQGDYPVTEVLIWETPKAGQDPGPDTQLNRMPKDAADSTIALLANDECLLPWLFKRNTSYDVAVTFYDQSGPTFRQVTAQAPVIFKGIKMGSTIVMRAKLPKIGEPAISFEMVED